MEKDYKKTGRGLEISRKKPVYLRFNGYWNLDGNSDINLQGENMESVNCICNFFPLSAVLLDEFELWFVMFCQCYVTVTMFCNNVSVLCLHVIVTDYVLIGEIACNKYPVLLLLDRLPVHHV